MPRCRKGEETVLLLAPERPGRRQPHASESENPIGPSLILIFSHPLLDYPTPDRCTGPKAGRQMLVECSGLRIDSSVPVVWYRDLTSTDAPKITQHLSL